MKEETKPTEPTPSLAQLLAAWLETNHAELTVGIKPAIGNGFVDPANFVPPGWTVVCMPVAKAK